MKNIYVFGHKNPDTDSVCSAIALAYLKSNIGLNCIPKVIGPINRGTKFVLDYFNVPHPSYINDVKVEIKDTKYTKKAFVNEKESIDNTFKFMKMHDLTAVPLVDDKKILSGYVTLKTMAKYLIDGDRAYIKTNLDHILETLNASIIACNKTDFEGIVKTVTFSSEAFIKEISLDEQNILVVGDRYKVIEYAIKSKVQLIILTRNRKLPKALLNKAIKNGVNIISSGYSSFELSNKISLANYIETINETKTPTTVDIHSYHSDFVALSKRLNYTNYPVVNAQNECLGVIKLTDFTNFERKKVILVDHNNYEQSVDGLGEAEILEIIDHHNLGNIGTSMPITFTSKPVGSTATIVYHEFKKERVEVPKDMAGLLLSAIISDTLLFTSSTTTNEDIECANELAKIAEVDINKYGVEMLKAASSIQGLSVTELINQDFKSYSINDKVYGIAVITTLDFDIIQKDIQKYVDKLNEMSQNTYEAVLIFIIDYMKKGSYVIYNSESEKLLKQAFRIDAFYEGIFIPGLTSRKKQIIPTLIQELDK